MHIVWRSLLGLYTLLVALTLAGAPAFAQQPQAKPNIVVIMADDVPRRMDDLWLPSRGVGGGDGRPISTASPPKA